MSAPEGASAVYDPRSPDAQFRPLRTASRGRLAAAVVLGPLLWVVGLVVVAWVVDQRNAVEAALIVTAASFAVAVPVLGLLHRLSRREEREHANVR